MEITYSSPGLICYFHGRETCCSVLAHWKGCWLSPVCLFLELHNSVDQKSIICDRDKWLGGCCLRDITNESIEPLSGQIEALCMFWMCVPVHMHVCCVQIYGWGELGCWCGVNHIAAGTDGRWRGGEGKGGRGALVHAALAQCLPYRTPFGLHGWLEVNGLRVCGDSAVIGRNALEWACPRGGRWRG